MALAGRVVLKDCICGGNRRVRPNADGTVVEGPDEKHTAAPHRFCPAADKEQALACSSLSR